MSRATHLKIKIMTLAYESRLIRKEERKALELGRYWKVMDHPEAGSKGKDPFLSGKLMDRYYREFESLQEHRKGKVRDAARLNHLAYGFIKGRPYSAMEARCHTPPDFKEVGKIARRFGAWEHKERWEDWLKEAEAHLSQAREAA